MVGESGTGDNSVTRGLSTREALNRLHQDIRNIIEEYEDTQFKSRYGPWMKDALHHTSQYTTLCWTSALALILNGLALFIASVVNNDLRFGYLPLESLIIFILVGINFYLVVRENKLRHREIPHRIYSILEKLKEAEDSSHWLPENYPHICSPYSPCITLQWTYRDGQLVNLPWALLVQGDIIDIRPGQQAPGHCVPLDEKDGPVLHAREMYTPTVETTHDVFNVPTARIPLKNKVYRLEETPYLNNLRLALDKALSRPVTYHNRERNLLMLKCIEQRLFTVLLVCVIIVNMLRYFYMNSWVGAGHWTEMFLLQPAIVSLPLLPLVFPAAWLALDSVGMARIHVLLHTTTHVQNYTVHI